MLFRSCSRRHWSVQIGPAVCPLSPREHWSGVSVCGRLRCVDIPHSNRFFCRLNSSPSLVVFPSTPSLSSLARVDSIFFMTGGFCQLVSRRLDLESRECRLASCNFTSTLRDSFNRPVFRLIKKPKIRVRNLPLTG